VLQTLDGTVRAFGIEGASWHPGAYAVDAIGRIVGVARELRPQVIRFLVDEGAASAAALRETITVTARAKDPKAKVEVALVPNVRDAMKKERQVVTADAVVLDACAGWLNLVGNIVSGIPNAKVVRLQ
jgi:hypothetical protein